MDIYIESKKKVFSFVFLEEGTKKKKLTSPSSTREEGTPESMVSATSLRRPRLERIKLFLLFFNI